ncbi:hypothetical protein NQZ68_017677 [Dissostichus eleginoides]|nr:hypothetical protein NQZ68_017677 [Dissostichus eleginoides]
MASRQPAAPTALQRPSAPPHSYDYIMLLWRQSKTWWCVTRVAVIKGLCEEKEGEEDEEEGSHRGTAALVTQLNPFTTHCNRDPERASFLKDFFINVLEQELCDTQGDNKGRGLAPRRPFIPFSRESRANLMDKTPPATTSQSYQKLETHGSPPHHSHSDLRQHTYHPSQELASSSRISQASCPERPSALDADTRPDPGVATISDTDGIWTALGMGVKGLQSFMDRCCPEACVSVNLREMSRQHAAKRQTGCTTTANSTRPTLVVDGMACLRHWYSCKDWVCGGQWREYMDGLKGWVEAFSSAGIRLVFFFDGVVEEQKRREWVKRRRRVNREISKLFRHIKAQGEQPGRELFCLPSGLATFTCFALRSLGQEVFCSVREADYEIASYARQHGSMGILGQDSDFIIYDSAPCFSVAKLRIHSLTTVMYDRQRLCQTIGLTVAQLPLLACLLGNDVVSEDKMLHIRNNAMATYRIDNPTAHSGAPQGQMVMAVSHLVSSVWGREEQETGLIPQTLNLSAPHRELLKRGVRSYLLPGEEAIQLGDISAPSSAFEKHVSSEILKACRDKHVAAEGFMVYSVLCEGVIECSNTLEDEEDTELLPQALVYKPCRQRIYGLLLLNGHEGSRVDLPAIREWFVYAGNALKEPDMVHPVPLSLQYNPPVLDLLWFGNGPEVSSLRLKSFLSMFDCQELSELYGAVEDSLLAALCLVTYIALQIQTLSQEDCDAYLSQAVCLRLKSPKELQHIKAFVPLSSGSLFSEGEAVFDWKQVAGRARTVAIPVQSGGAAWLSLRPGAGPPVGANCASGGPLPGAALMPWSSFDGRLFHSKYLLAHSGSDNTVLLDRDPFCLSQFLCLREKLTETCRKRGRVLQSRPKAPQQAPGPPNSDRHTARWSEDDSAVVGRTGAREERRQEEDGGREGRQEETLINVKTEKDCGREEEEEREENIFTLIPEVDRIAAEADTSWLLDGHSLLLQEHNP